MIRAQQRERLPALRAAVPALKVPDDLNPGQVRVIPPPRTLGYPPSPGSRLVRLARRGERIATPARKLAVAEI
jgi:hypothetical protein